MAMPSVVFNRPSMRGPGFVSRAGLLALITLCGPALAAGPGRDALTRPADAAVLASYAADFKSHNVTLAQPFFEGRAPGTRGNVLAAEYLEFNFRKFGLTPAFPMVTKSADGTEVSTPGSTYRQPFQMGTNLKVAMEKVAYSAGGVEKSLRGGTDFNTLGFSGDGDVTCPVAFCGYSIVKGENGYTSYPEGTDLKGKIALVMRFEPMDENGQSLWGGSAWTFAATLEPKIIAATERGAAGVILVCAPGANDDRVSKLETIESSRPGREARKVPVVMMSVEAADAMVRAGDAQGRSLMDLRKIADTSGEIIDLPNTEVTLATDVERQPIMTDNVGGVLAGAGDLADQYIIIGAHYDHVGYGYFGSRDASPKGKLHPGADDNASGTSAMLVLADRLSKVYAELPPDQARRSILFLGFSAEESGLNGSRHYVRNPSVPKDKTYIMLNLDMVGRMKDEQIEISGVGTGEGLADFVKPYFDSSGLKIASKPGGGGPSDHASFNAVQIPVMFFFTGLHAEYHKPTDIAALINNDGAARVVDLVERMTLDLARRPEAMAYPSGAESAASTQPAMQGDSPAPGPTRSRVRFGIAPGDYSGSEKGVLVGDVFPDTPAATAGLKKGDLMIRWNGKDLDSVEAWMPLLAGHSPGDEVEIVYKRDGQEMTTKTVLTGRRTGNQ
ncbi:MAG: M28 family peptidase [Phycisphaerales bacterium]|nr:M28 family peptidase [Phycisphaerales bacterium]